MDCTLRSTRSSAEPFSTAAFSLACLHTVGYALTSCELFVTRCRGRQCTWTQLIRGQVQVEAPPLHLRTRNHCRNTPEKHQRLSSCHMTSA